MGNRIFSVQCANANLVPRPKSAALRMSGAPLHRRDAGGAAQSHQEARAGNQSHRTLQPYFQAACVPSGMRDPVVCQKAGTSHWRDQVLHLLLQSHESRRTSITCVALPSDLTDTHSTLGSQDYLLFENDTDARYCRGLVCQPLCLWTGGVNMAISTFETLPGPEPPPH